MFRLLLIVAIGSFFTKTVYAQNVNVDTLQSIAENLCLHLDSLEEVQHYPDAIIEIDLQVELSDLVDYLPYSQQELVKGWDDNPYFAQPFVKTLDGNRVFSSVLSDCPGAAERYLAQKYLSVEDSSIRDKAFWPLLVEFTLEQVGPESLKKVDITIQHSLAEAIANHPEAKVAYAQAKNLIGAIKIDELLIAELSKAFPELAARSFPESFEMMMLKKHFEDIGLDSMNKQLAIIKAQNDIDSFCRKWEIEGNFEEIDLQATIYIKSDEETSALFKKYYDGPELSESVLETGAGVLIFIGVLEHCISYKKDLRKKGMMAAVESLEPAPSEIEALSLLAERLCGCLSLGLQGGKGCITKLLQDHGLKDSDMRPGVTLSPEKKRVKEALITLIPYIGASCLPNH